MEPSFLHRRTLACCLIFSFSAAVWFAFLNWPSESLQIASKSFGGADLGPRSSLELLRGNSIRAGWPLNYWTVLVPDVSPTTAGPARQVDPPPVTLRWSTWSLAGNLG